MAYGCDDFVRKPFRVADIFDRMSAFLGIEYLYDHQELFQVGVEQGHGLGLSIVKRIIDKLDGEVGLKSQEGEGSTFFFALPAA